MKTADLYCNFCACRLVVAYDHKTKRMRLESGVGLNLLGAEPDLERLRFTADPEAADGLRFHLCFNCAAWLRRLFDEPLMQLMIEANSTFEDNFSHNYPKNYPTPPAAPGSPSPPG